MAAPQARAHMGACQKFSLKLPHISCTCARISLILHIVHALAIKPDQQLVSVAASVLHI